MHRGVPDERRATADTEWFPGATGRARILCDLLDEMPVVDSRAGRARRKLLDEDGVSRAGQSARQHECGGWESRQSENRSNRAVSRAIVSHLSRRFVENPRRAQRHVARDCLQWIWPCKSSRDFGRRWKNVDRLDARRRPRRVFFPHLGSAVESKVTGTLFGGRGRDG